jgi:hypothetical protein
MYTQEIRSEVDNDGTLDKEATSYNDIFDAFRLDSSFIVLKKRVVELIDVEKIPEKLCQ